MLTIYHNPQCKKSRAGLEFLKASGEPFMVREYLKQPLSEKELEKLLVKLNMKPADLIRTQEAAYRTTLKGKSFNDHELVRILCDNPKLIRRPVVERKYAAVIGDPVENIRTLLSSS